MVVVIAWPEDAFVSACDLDDANLNEKPPNAAIAARVARNTLSLDFFSQGN